MKDNQYKICPKCRSINNIGAQSCAFCGSALDSANVGFSDAPCSDIGGVPIRDVTLFIGNKAPLYLKKFYKKSQGKKIGMNFFVLLLGIVFSAVAQSFWFFNRRMNKIGAVIFAVGILFTGATLYSTYRLEQYTEPLSQIQTAGAENYLKSIEKQTSGENISKAILSGDYIKGLDSEQKAELSILSRGVFVKYAIYGLIALCSLMFSVAVAAFADYAYYKFTLRKIKAIRVGPNYCDDALRFGGGTKTVTWAILLIFTVAAYIAAVLLIGAKI